MNIDGAIAVLIGEALSRDAIDDDVGVVGEDNKVAISSCIAPFSIKNGLFSWIVSKNYWC